MPLVHSPGKNNPAENNEHQVQTQQSLDNSEVNHEVSNYASVAIEKQKRKVIPHHGVPITISNFLTRK